ncbi:hypothetical protein FSP39_000060 [Pinctada imbricata]|uniref:Uncharacterized protein n=1 Tax=Pinctada imbricata TaxID=66713 RepID=A0AA88XYG0_PINIB|nr:hypothetical protein FSP39_000060 [Pinctada imbricata]
MSDQLSPEDGGQGLGTKKIPVIHYDMLDKSRFYPLIIVSNSSIRMIIFPFTNLTTKLQAQRGNNMYSSLWDCIVKTKQQEGLPGFYKGGAVRILGQIPSSFVYITTLERSKFELRQMFPNYEYTCSAVAGMLASLAAQVIGNPIEIVSQTLILMSKGDQKATSGKNIDLIDISKEVRTKKGFSRVKSIFLAVHKQRGLQGFWKGYQLSAITMAIGSAFWWPLYFFFSGKRFDLQFAYIEDLK